jgi:hypothetical protein
MYTSKYIYKMPHGKSLPDALQNNPTKNLFVVSLSFFIDLAQVILIHCHFCQSKRVLCRGTRLPFTLVQFVKALWSMELCLQFLNVAYVFCHYVPKLGSLNAMKDKRWNSSVLYSTSNDGIAASIACLRNHWVGKEYLKLVSSSPASLFISSLLKILMREWDLINSKCFCWVFKHRGNGMWNLWI